jgi:transposase InsO family protein
MPWKDTRVMDERTAFVEAWLKRASSVSELCERFGISRKTGHKWIGRYHQGGLAGLVDQTRAPRERPQAVCEAVVTAVVALRRKHEFWGPKKLRAVLKQTAPETKWPAVSTIGEILKRHGLVKGRRKRHRVPKSTQPLAAATAPNVVWSADYKGQFRVAGRWCYPLTITDNCSRMLLRVQSVKGVSEEEARPIFESAFREYGLPWRLRTDNGSPFASKAIAGLSMLSVWWVKLGIVPERIKPGHPEENPRHERMHRTLKQETATPPRSTEEIQQSTFDEFRKHFNEERPHEALGQETPVSRYKSSTRAFPEVLGDPDYPDGFQPCRVYRNGAVRWCSVDLHLGTVLGQEVVGIEPVAEDTWQIWFGPIYLGLCRREAKGRVELIKNTG